MIKYLISHLHDKDVSDVGIMSEIAAHVFGVVVTYILTVMLTTNTDLNGDGNLYDVLGGIITAVLYLQSVSLGMSLLSYFSKHIRKFRSCLTLAILTTVYIVAKVIAFPDPVDPIYSYAASISGIVVVGAKLRDILYNLVADLRPTQTQSN